MIPSWLSDTVKSFGRQFGLGTLELSDRGTAGMRFGDGRELLIEYSQGRLSLLVTVPNFGGAEAIRRLLALAHPSAQRGVRIRTGLMPDGGKAFLHARLAEREVAVDTLEGAFGALWTASSGIGRAA